MIREPLFAQTGRLAIFPIQDHVAWDFYKKAQSLIWSAEEIQFSKDLDHWENLSPDIQLVVEAVLGFFAGADRIVNINIVQNMMSKIDIPEINCFYAFQLFMENVHNETYSLMIETLIRDQDRKAALLQSCDTMPAIAALYNWTRRWIGRTSCEELGSHSSPPATCDLMADDIAETWCFAKTVVAQACLEGIAFSGAFAIIFYIKERGVLPGLTFSNELISRDEGLHRDFACYIYSKVVNKPPAEDILAIVSECVAATQGIIASCMNRLPGMNREDMNIYIEFVADSLLLQLGYAKHYNRTNPFDFMEKISFSGITNFFERRVAEYSKTGFEDGHDDEICLDENY
jgi:ribonucleotide reductase beta subunit family protein with ferritin-like domain